jgi:hypothetical protein
MAEKVSKGQHFPAKGSKGQQRAAGIKVRLG